VDAGDPLTRRLLLVAAVGAVTFVAVWAVDGATRAGYRPSQHPVSALALGDRGWVQVANFVLAGVAMAAFAVAVHRTFVDGPAAAWAPALLAACAVGLVASGMFVMDAPAGYPPGTPIGGGRSWRGALHDVAGLVVFTTLPAAAIVSGVRFRGDHDLRWLGTASIGAGLLAAAAFLAFAIVDESGRAGAGLVQRAAIVVGWGWVAAVATTLLVVDPEH
jgi:hypothetical protein